MNEEIFESTHISNDKWRFLINLVKKGQLPPLNIGEDRPYTRDDFKDSLNSRYENIKHIEKQLSFVVINIEDKVILEHFVAPLIGEFYEIFVRKRGLVNTSPKVK